MADTYTALIPLKWTWTDQPAPLLLASTPWVRADGPHVASLGTARSAALPAPLTDPFMFENLKNKLRGPKRPR